MRRRSGAVLLAAVCAAVALLGSGCAAAVDGQAFASGTVTAGVDPGFVKGSDGSDDDRLAAAVLHDLEGWWGGQFPKLANGAKFTPLKGYFSVDSSRDGPGPPCTDAASEVEGNAFYCPNADIIAYDRAALLPVLRQKFGDSAVVVVIAHEFGHAVQQRLESSSPTAAGLSSGAPTILSEGQADCYAGGFLRAVHDGATPDLRTGDRGIDAAMSALITFRDPVGTDAGDDRAHGNAFDRVSSFQDGYDGGPSACAGMTLQNRTFTQQSFATLSDAQSGGNLPLPDLLRSMGTDLDRYFGGLVRQRGRQWTPPTIREGQTGCGPDAVDLCAGTPATLAVDDRALARIHDGIGDYASGTVLASRYAMAALAALGRPTTGAQAGSTALCLAGAYTGDVGKPGADFSLSPGDLDEAVGVLQRDDSAARGTDGVSAAGGAYARIADFRQGVSAGAGRCLGN
ncbi:neutral zinc metallopeptidase [Actinomycetospora endophytica]|uniref:Neutral zinc metallopeptidase n=1 Tax=Actinomycetospora endophytica TaxID=2291215 RepID=A0ABS8PG45_9PSEU|nr:neutral zinc metallopeptidase [Actinomycetospora endophytica]MCD2196978.1 neutral zinc metallopeptidase [Actinomycetospora endophytica]